jgi:alkylation response protein AidB-like acyl-CoA dehydrogenase
MIGGAGGPRQKITTVDEHAKTYVGSANGKISDEAIRHDVVSLRMDERAYQLTLQRSVEETSTTKAPGFLSSMFKLYGTEQNIRRQDLTVSIMGIQGLGWSGDGFAPVELNATRGWLRSKANSIEGGSSEVMRNIIAKRILGLPD